MDSVFFKPWVRTILIWAGLILTWLLSYGVIGYGEPYVVYDDLYAYTYQDQQPSYWFFTVLAIALLMTGCYIWTRLKNRAWVFMLWGLLAPIGLLGISLLRDKSKPLETGVPIEEQGTEEIEQDEIEQTTEETEQ